MERLKQKVASSSSRVIASIQQAATGTFQSSSSSSSSASTSRQPQEAGQQQQQQSALQVDADQVGSRLMADADATAHLTEEEREILLEVFKKEAEFQRDTIIQMGAASQSQLEQLEPDQRLFLQQQDYPDRVPSRRSSQRDKLTLAQRQTSTSSTRGQQQANRNQGQYRSQAQSMYQSQSQSQSQYQSPSPATTLDTSNSSSTTTASTYLASARSSATPSSRPASSVFGDTPVNQVGARRRESSARVASSCSSSDQQQQQQPNQPLGQCRICRKVILTNEPCHLCSNCNQFICEDCASYSASDQHWMCSSCRRRTTKPAIPAEALRELGLNQNSSPVRRMTLRLNQHDLRLDLSKGSSESNASSNSSSGCSSMSTAPPTHQPSLSKPPAGLTRPSIQQQQQQQQQQVRQTIRSSGEGRQATLQQPDDQSRDRLCDSRPASQQQLARRRGSNADTPASGQTATTDARYNAQKTLSNPVAQPTQDTAQARATRLAAVQRSSGPSGVAASNQTASQMSSGEGVVASRSTVPERIQQQQQQQQLRQQTRRASVAAADNSGRGRAAGRAQQAGGPVATFGRKQSSGNFVLMQTQAGHSSFATNFGYVMDQAQSESLMLSAGQRRQSVQQHPNHDNYHHQQQQQFLMNQPRTMVTASSELSMSAGYGGDNMDGRRESSASARGSIGGGGSLIPIPPDQIHLRRLSDQSSLVRRSSIIADTIDVVNMQHRNRSHSNIDTVSYALYQPQFQVQPQQQTLDYSDENLRDSYAGRQLGEPQSGGPQRRGSNLVQHRQPQQQMSSIITSYSQKQRRSSDDLHTDSSSDIDEDLQANPTNLELDNEQPNEYFAPPRGLDYSASMSAAEQQRQTSCFVDLSNQSAGVSIPSVSVSEFRSSQQRLSQVQLHQPQPEQPPLMQLEQLMTSPVQINVAIEQAIQLQQQRQDLVQQYLPASDMLAAAHHHQQQQQHHHHQLPVGYSALAPRRGSSGRILPQIPSDQSQSLLDLPFSAQAAPVLGPNQFSPGGVAGVPAGRNSLSNGSMNRLSGIGDDQRRLGSTLDLPSASQTIRRASAPEGQNIKIVVDDMDGTMMRSNGCCSGSVMMVMDPSGALIMQPNGSHQTQQHHHHQYGKQGELYERLVLYRDDSLDPNTNMARGFGLQVMGGKIDENGKLQACVVWILAGGPADKVGLKCGDKIIEWDGKCLVNMTYEQVADVIESSANIAELLVKPAHRLEVQSGSANVVRSQRRLSHQTERDFKKILQQQQRQAKPDEMLVATSGQHQSHRQWHQSQRPVGQQQAEQASHLREASSNLQPHHQTQAISAGNSPLRSGTGRKLPKIPGGGGPFQDTGLNVSSTMSQMKVNSSSTSHLEQQSGTYFAPARQQEQQNSLFVSQLQPEQRTLSAQIGSLQSAQQPQQQTSWHQVQPQHLGSYNPLGKPAPVYTQTTNPNLWLPSQTEVFGLIGLQVNVDERACQLEISVLSAINLNLSPSQDYFVRLRILPESNRFKACKTLPRSDLNWKETFLFQNFPIDQINRMALEIGVWLHEDAPRLTTQLAQPICEAMIPIQSARERNTDFWPLRQPPSSPQTRRKSLNDLLETQHRQQEDHLVGAQLSAGYLNTNNPPINWQTNSKTTSANQQAQHQLMIQSQGGNQSQLAYGGESGAFVRGRSSSNRNLPDTNKLRAQPRRASDEVAGSSSQRLSSRLSPAPSRRSISVINVGPESSSSAGLFRSPSRLGSQSNLLKGQQQRRDSGAAQQYQSQQQQQSSSGESPVLKFGSPKGSSTRVGEQPALRQASRQPSGEGLTPSGRRSSLVGIHNMIGYASQKSSLSDASDQKASSKSAAGAAKRSSQPSSAAGSQRGSLSASADAKQRTPNRPESSQRTSASSNSGQGSPVATSASRAGNGSRRGSIEHGAHKLERKGSFAMLTLRKLKRTMSLTKGADQETPDSNQESRRSSSEYEADAGEDLGLTRRLIGQTEFVGRLKLSFIMTKGQLEIDVISAQGLKYDLESSLGVYVKMYLKGRNKSNKRKTRLVQPWESPVFRQLIKYDGCLVDNKSLEVSLWQKQGGLKGKIPIGFTEVRLSELSLNQLQTSWYNLRPMEMMCSSSIED